MGFLAIPVVVLFAAVLFVFGFVFVVGFGVCLGGSPCPSPEAPPPAAPLPAAALLRVSSLGLGHCSLR
jgi:hypothetical protein